MNKISYSNLSTLESQRKKRHGRATRRHSQQSHNNAFFNGTAGQRLDRNTVNEKLGNLLFGAFMPSQMSHDPPHGPEYLLMVAVLEDAWDTYRHYRNMPGRRSERLWREAEVWFQSSEDHWPFSFLNICAALGLDADYVRARVFRKEAA